MSFTSTTAQPGDGEAPPLLVEVEREFKSSPEAVFDAWLDTRTLGQWLFATPQGEMLRVESNPVVGGEFIVVERRGEQIAEHFGTWLELVRPSRIVFRFSTSRNEEGVVVTVELSPSAHGCVLKLSHKVPPPWAHFVERSREGWTKILVKLASLLDEEANSPC